MRAARAMAFGILLTTGLLPGVLPSPALAADSLGQPVGVPFTRELPAGATLSAVDVFHDEQGITGLEGIRPFIYNQSHRGFSLQDRLCFWNKPKGLAEKIMGLLMTFLKQVYIARN